jgi:hypothetical protein
MFFLTVDLGFAVDDHGVLLKTTNGGGNIMGIKYKEIKPPEKFHLSQNYPNPFNPITKIVLNISRPIGAKGTPTQLIIYDLLGRQITVLLNEYLKPGIYEVEWDGSNYASGVYFYKLITADFSETRKMVLVK